jgi:hypothetical protein
MEQIKIGEIVAYMTCCDSWHNAQVTYIYDGEKYGQCQLYISELKQHFDYPINELLTNKSMG